MGFFGSIKKAVKKVTKPVAKVAPKAITAVATGGVSLAVPSVGKKLEPLFAPTTFSQLTKTASLVAAPATGGTSMAFNTNQFLGAVGGILGNSSIGAIQTVGNLATLTQQFIPATTQRPMMSMVQGGQAIPVSNVPAARGQQLTKEIFDAGNKLLTRLGIRYPATSSGFTAALRRALSAIASLARRTPAGTLVSVLIGIGLSVYEANLLTGWSATRKRRRQINPANAKALRRSVRRIKAFHKMCVHVDVLKSRGRRSHVAVGSRCGTCRKSPCRC